MDRQHQEVREMGNQRKRLKRGNQWGSWKTGRCGILKASEQYYQEQGEIGSNAADE